MAEESIFELEKSEQKLSGGKARGLQRLSRVSGIQIPATVFIPSDAPLPELENLQTWLQKLGPQAKAVRSSAVAEDGEQASFAGQFESYLNLSQVEEIHKAIQKCRQSAQSQRVESYTDQKNKDADTRVGVLIQNMVEAQYSGVLFTADPVQNRRDLMLISVGEGLGDKLVSGEVSGEQYTLSHGGQSIEIPESPLLSEAQLKELRESALRIAQEWERPVDLEWAIDTEGRLIFLQCRPITNLASEHWNELDHPYQKQDILTRCNIGEMMPGAVTPLTHSVFAYAIEQGMQDFLYHFGALKERSEDYLYVKQYYGHLFLNLEKMYDTARNVLLAKKENVELSILGETLPQVEVLAQAPFSRRLLNLVRYFGYLNTASKQLKKLEKLEKNFVIRETQKPEDLYEQLSAARLTLVQAYAYHYVTSGQSAAMYLAILQIVSKRALIPSPEHHQFVSSLLGDIEGVESADAVQALEKLSGQIRSKPDWAQAFVEMEESQGLIFLQESGPEELRQAFQSFLNRHGHRCVREAELREKDWASEPRTLIQLLQVQVKTLGLRPKKDAQAGAEKRKKQLAKLSFIPRQWTKYLLPKARLGVRQREQSKAWCIAIQSRIKVGYLQLAEQLCSRGDLDDPDQIFFLEHAEIGGLLQKPGPKWAKIAHQRRKIYPELMKLQFQDTFFHKPEPELSAQPRPDISGELVGIPVSSGEVEAPVRIIHSLEEAQAIEQGEILVVRFTDVGWTPYFSLISGLITEIGSPLSHGAVVAREYDLPAIVNVKGATQILKNGEIIRLNGSNGRIDRQEELEKPV